MGLVGPSSWGSGRLRRLIVVAGLTLVAVSCGGEDEGAQAGTGDADSDPTVAFDDSSTGADDMGDGTGAGSGEGTVGDTEDAADITGNPDLDLDELAEVAPEAAAALDDIDNIVSIGECSSTAVGLTMSVVPDGWECRVLDQPGDGGLDGFTLFQPGAVALEITVGTPSPLGPLCESLQMCDQAEPIDLGSTTTMSMVDLGVPIVFGTHNTVDAEIVVAAPSALTPDQIEFVTTVLEGLVAS